MLAGGHGTAQKAVFRSINGRMSLRFTSLIKNYDFNINGKLDQTHKLEGEIPVSQADHWFGNRLDGAWPYKGMLDEFVIYNRVLTEAEIQQDMNQVLSVSPLDKTATTWGMLKRDRDVD